MEPLLSLPPNQFRAALAELQLDPAREAALVDQYNAMNAPERGGRDRGMLRNLLDNIIGFDDEIVTPGERLGSGVQQFASGLLSDPLGTAGDIVQGGYQTIEGAMAPGATPMDVLGAAGMAMGAGGLLSRPAGSVGMGGRVAPDARASDWIDDLRSRYPGAQIDVSGGPGRGYTVSRVVVPEDARSQGLGTQIMREITDIADSQGATVALTPSSDFGGNVGRLRDFYSRLGFVGNTGRNRDLSISEEMYREPISANRSTAAGLLASAAETPAQRVAGLLREGRASEVTDDLMAQADPQEMYRLYVAGETGADLPMDEASRMARAQEMGFDVDTPLYHGTPGADIQAFRASRSGAAGPGVYTSQMPSTASGYAEGIGLFDRRNAFSDEAGTWIEGGNVLDVLAPRNLQSSEDWTANMMAQMSSNPMSRQQASAGATQQAISEGFQGAQARSPISSMGRNVVVFDPVNIRSRFARFDPRLSHLANLNAANVDPITGAAAVSASQQNDPLANLRAFIAANGGILGR
jgi:GNAT superfamily N-acetyltransferase